MPTRSKSTAAKSQATASDVAACEVTRHVSETVTAMLWGRAAGRCQFWGCNTPLWKSHVTQESVNRAQRAHIYAFSSGGPRGNEGIDQEKLNDFDNLMLVCHGCHRTIDKHKDGGRYSATLLKQWKQAHERRVEIVTGIDPSKKSHVVLYGANIGDHSSPLNFNEAAMALFPHAHPAEDRPIELSMINSIWTDRNAAFWEREAEQLRVQFERRVGAPLARGDIGHLSVFGLAPQPLLILLGSLMTDIPNADVYQRHREPQTWSWPDAAEPIEFRVSEPLSHDGQPALVVALSAEVTDDRITDVLPHASIWRISVPEPNTDLIKSREHLSQFRAVVRPLLDRIKAIHGQRRLLHVFPVVGVSTATDLGRVRMPKSQMPWQLYDQVNARGGFVPALLLPSGAPS